MSRDPKTELKFDRRLTRRRRWVSQDELEEELARLPDVADRAEPVAYPGDGDSPPGADPRDSDQVASPARMRG